MDVTAPVTDYLRGSLLTTKGDLVKRGAAVAARLGIGLAGQIIRVNATPDDLEYQHPGQFLFDNELSAENAGIVNVTTGWHTIVTLDLGTVVNGDRFFLSGRHDGPKVTAGVMILRIEQDSGTATIQVNHDGVSFEESTYAPNGLPTIINLNGIIRVTGSGTLVMALTGSNNVGSVAIAAGQGEIYATQLKNA